MECQHASEVVISAADGELVEAALLAEARMHCATCPQCRSVERLLERLSALPSPKAPEPLIARIEAAAGDVARENRDAAIEATIELPTATAPMSGRRRWMRFAALASSAAVLLLGLSVGALLIDAQADKQMAEETAFDVREDSAAAPDTLGDAPAESTLAAPQQQAAPAYIVFDGYVYVQSAEPVPSVLATAGTVVSDLGTVSSSERTAMSAPGSDDPLFIQGPDSAYMTFSRVVRTFARSEYGLTSETPIAQFGQWPSLPSAYATPQNADGSPTFTERGFDDHGQAIFVPASRALSGAFAIAPGTPEDDPAMGNPNWTWWVKLD